VQAASVVGKQKGSSPPGAMKVANISNNLEKKETDAKASAKREGLLAKEAEKLKKMNEALKRKMSSEDAYLREQQKQQMIINKADKGASDFLHNRNRVRVNPKTSTIKTSLRRRI